MPDRATNNAQHYRAVSLLWEGGSTVVYRARRDSGEPVIIKALKRPEPLAAELADLEREFEITLALKSKNVIRAYALEPFRNAPALVFHDIGGESLEKLCREQGFSVQESLAVALEIADGLEAIHATNLVHNAITPAHIIFNRRSGELNIVDFTASRAPSSENFETAHGKISAANVPYTSPEQTGRMNRPVDYRSDYYSLGVTLYQLLSGKLPFDAADPMELVHAHLAKTPPSPRELNPDIPLPVANIILKLLAKTADDRYQSMACLKRDLRTCLDQLAQNGSIRDFEIGQNDFANTLLLPQKLYGRSKEGASLIHVYERAAAGARELVLVSGGAGTGKTVLVNELYRHATKRGAYFIRGKFDQYRHDSPYQALAQAFTEFVDIVMSEDQNALLRWQRRLQQAIGRNGRLLLDLIPRLTLLLGEQDDLPQLGGTEAQNRFGYVLRSFVGAISSREHPVVLFLDDLHWADSGSLDLMSGLLANEEASHFLVIGNFRRDEVDSDHPLSKTVQRLKRQGVPALEIRLDNLSRHDVAQLISDALHSTPSYVRPLADAVHQRTQGNPFFTKQILLTLHHEKMLELEGETGVWHWHLAGQDRWLSTGNVVDFLVRKIQRLPNSTLESIKYAACMGNRSPIVDVATACARSSDEVRDYLAPAAEEGLVVLSANELKFAHDRVQQAAYSLLEEQERKRTHLLIGSRLLAHTPLAQRDERIFEIANQLNAAVELIDNPDERHRLLALNLAAAKRSIRSTAYQSAVIYARNAARLAPANYWDMDHDAAYALYSELGQAEYLAGNYGPAKGLIDGLLQNASTTAQRVRSYTLLKDLLANQGKQYGVGVNTGLRVARDIGLDFPDAPDAVKQMGQRAMAGVAALMAEKGSADLLALPAMDNPEMRLTMRFLMDLWEAAYYHGDPSLMQLCNASMVEMSLRHGNMSESAFGYVVYGAHLAAAQDYDQAYRMGTLALELNRRSGDNVLLPKVNNLFCNYINIFKRPFHTNVPLYEDSVRSGRDNGDFLFGVWAAFLLLWSHLMSGHKLDFVYSKSLQLWPFVRQTNDQKMIHAYRLLQYVLLNLQGKTPNRNILEDETSGVREILASWKKDRFIPGMTWFAILACQLLYLYEYYEESYEIVKKYARALAPELIMFPISQYYFCHALSTISIYHRGDQRTRRRHLKELGKSKAIIDAWAKACPDNFLAQQLILEAELGRINGQNRNVAHLYGRAVRVATEQGLVQMCALANELAAKYWLSRNRHELAKDYITRAVQAYRQWGATRKADMLAKGYLQLADHNDLFAPAGFMAAEPPPAPGGDEEVFLDLEAAIKSAQTISEEIDLRQLLAKMIRIMIEDAGAQNGFLVIEQEGVLRIEAQATADNNQVRVLCGLPIDECNRVSSAIIRYVVRTGSSVVLHNASEQGHFTNDPHIERSRVKSVLCVPLRHQGKLVAVLYLENNLSSNIFTESRLKILNILLSQAAISLVNARLYQALQKEIDERRQAEGQVRLLLDSTSEAIYGIDTSARCIFANPACVRMLGYSHADELLGGNMHVLAHYAHPDGAPYPREECEICRAFREGEGVHKDSEVLWRKDGTCFPAEYWAYPIRRDGEIVGAVITFIDISERRTVEEELARYRDHLEELVAARTAELETINRELEAFSYSVSHDLRTPLRGVEGFSAVLLRDYGDKLDEAGQGYLRRVRAGVQRMAMLIDALLNLSRITRRDMHVEPVDMAALAREVAAQLHEQYPGRAVEVVIGDELRTHGDKPLLHVMLENLLGNAWKFTAKKEHARIEFRATLEEGERVYTLHDNGAGFDMAHAEKLFGAFQRLHGFEEFEGTGIGLATVARIIRRHGGRIWAEGKVGEGATFYFTLGNPGRLTSTG